MVRRYSPHTPTRHLTTDFSLTIPEVASNPIYPLPTPPHPTGSSACVVCPTRIFKNEHMEKSHLESKAHKRSMKRWEAYLARAEAEGRELEGDPRLIVEDIMDNVEAAREVSFDVRGLSPFLRACLEHSLRR